MFTCWIRLLYPLFEAEKFSYKKIQASKLQKIILFMKKSTLNYFNNPRG